MRDFDPESYLMNPAWHSSRYGLERMRELMHRLGDPQNRLHFVHVAGTNGKGSTCAFLHAILREAGYRVGLYTSPHLEKINERVVVDNRQISPEELAVATKEVRNAAEAMAEPDPENHPTEFELMTAVAFVHFARQACDIVVLEVGLGGRLDATNIILAPEVAVLTRLGLDHTAILGDTLEKIASEKAGIIKTGSAVVAFPGERDSVNRVIAERAREVGVSVGFADYSRLSVGAFDPSAGARSFTYRDKTYATRMPAVYQPENVAVAIEAVNALRERGWHISPEAEAEGIAKTFWPGRFEILGANPVVVIDGGHNAQGAQALVDTIRDVLPRTRPVFIMGMLADKDYLTSARLLAPMASAFFTVTPPNERALDSADLARVLQDAVAESGLGERVRATRSFAEAARDAYDLACATGQPLCAFGSLYQLAEVRQALRAVM